MPDLESVVDAMEVEMGELRDEYKQFRNLKIGKAYIFTDDFIIPQVKDFAVFICPETLSNDRRMFLGNRADEYYYIRVILLLKLERTKNQAYFVKALQLLERYLLHNTLNNELEVVGNNVSSELIDTGDSNTLGARIFYVGRKKVSI